MKRNFSFLAVCLGLLLSVSASSAMGATQPVLGGKGAFLHGKGFGTIKPPTVFLGGDPTGRVSSITWQNWGGQRATGYGQGWCPGSSVANGHRCQAALRASSLGLCHGRRAYRSMLFLFKSGTTWTVGSRWNICRGQAA